MQLIIYYVQVTETEGHQAGGFQHEMLVYTVEFKAQPVTPFEP